MSIYEGWNSRVSDLREKLEELSQDAHSYADERSEKWQESEQGEAISSEIDKLDQVISDLEEVCFGTPG